MPHPTHFDGRPPGDGIWIPAVVWNDLRITWREATLYGYLVAYGWPSHPHDQVRLERELYGTSNVASEQTEAARRRLLELGLVTPAEAGLT